MEELSFAFWLQAAIELIVLICFLILCSNVSKIRKKLIPNDRFNACFSMYLAMGDKETARKILCEEISKQPEFIMAFRNNLNNADARKLLEKKYKAHLESLGLSFDFSASDKFIFELNK